MVEESPAREDFYFERNIKCRRIQDRMSVAGDERFVWNSGSCYIHLWVEGISFVFFFTAFFWV
jgi:hypothetical protein